MVKDKTKYMYIGLVQKIDQLKIANNHDGDEFIVTSHSLIGQDLDHMNSNIYSHILFLGS